VYASAASFGKNSAASFGRASPEKSPVRSRERLPTAPEILKHAEVAAKPRMPTFERVSSPLEEQLTKLFKHIGTEESALEMARQMLARQAEFEPRKAFD